MNYKITLNESIGLQLKEFRNQYKIKSKELASFLKKSPAYISKLENGQLKHIYHDEFVKITNFITKSSDGYYLFCEKLSEKSDTKELDQNVLLLNFDTNERKLPISEDLIEEIKKRMAELKLSSKELADYINRNEDLDQDFLIEHKINPEITKKNIWIPYQDVDNHNYPHFYIFIQISSSQIDDILNKTVRKCSYMSLYAIMYHILKIYYQQHGNTYNEFLCDQCKTEAEDILLKHKFYTLKTQAKLHARSESYEEYTNLLNEFDIDNSKYISSIFKKILYLSKYDVSYTNKLLKSILDNMEECELSFAMAFMSTSLAGIKNLQPTLKKEFLHNVEALIAQYSEYTESVKNIERY